MSDHLHAYVPDPEDKHPNQPFFAWLKSRTALFVSQLLALLGFIYVPASTLYYVANLEHNQFLMGWNPYVQIIVDVAHLAVLTLFVVVMLGIRHDNKAGGYRTLLAYGRLFNDPLDEKKAKLRVKQGRLQLRRFKHYFLYFWIAMLALYISFTFKHGYELYTSLASRPAAEASAAAAPGAHNAAPGAHDTTTPAAPAQESAAQPTGHETAPPMEPGKPTDTPAVSRQSTGPELGRIEGLSKVFDFLFFPFLTFALNNLSMMFIFWCFVVTYLPSYDRRSNIKHRLHIGFSSFFFVMLTLFFPLLLVVFQRGGFTAESLTGYATVFDGVSGVFNAVVVALLIARLDSKLIGLRSWLIGLLYFYSAVQPLFAVFEQPGDVFKLIQTSVLIIVFGFKVYFFLIILYALQTGRMLNYLICFPQLAQRVDSIWDNQFEVRAHEEKEGSFHITIMKKNQKVYTACDHFKTIEDCDRKNTELREVMKQDKSYGPNEQNGTHWVEVSNFHRHKIFRSGSLKSEEEVQDLIKESINKIPYCKYERG